MATAKRKVAKKAAVKKVVPSKVKKATVKKAAAAPKARKTASKPIKKVEASKPVKITAPSKPYTQSELVQTLTDTTSIPRKDVKVLFEQLKLIIEAHLGKSGPGMFTLPGLLKLTVQTKPATKARKGTNPFTGEEMMFKAKPARKVVKIRALRKLKEAV